LIVASKGSKPVAIAIASASTFFGTDSEEMLMASSKHACSHTLHENPRARRHSEYSIKKDPVYGFIRIAPGDGQTFLHIPHPEHFT
jgi:hypothetical protein